MEKPVEIQRFDVFMKNGDHLRSVYTTNRSRVDLLIEPNYRNTIKNLVISEGVPTGIWEMYEYKVFNADDNEIDFVRAINRKNASTTLQFRYGDHACFLRLGDGVLTTFQESILNRNMGCGKIVNDPFGVVFRTPKGTITEYLHEKTGEYRYKLTLAGQINPIMEYKTETEAITRLQEI